MQFICVELWPQKSTRQSIRFKRKQWNLEEDSLTSLNSVRAKEIRVNNIRANGVRANCGDATNDTSKINESETHGDANNVLEYVERAAKKHVKKNVHLGPKKATVAPADWELMRKRFGYLSIDVVQKTFDNTKQLAKGNVWLPLQRYLKSRFPQANVNRLHEMFSTVTFFSSAQAIGGETMWQAELQSFLI